MIKELKLTNFRKFKNLSLNFNERVTVIYADNAVGKSSILEALYLICNQSSPFASDYSEIYNFDQVEADEYFRVEIKNVTEDESSVLAHFQTTRGRQYYKNQSKTARKKITENIASVIFSPEQIEILMLSPDRRRQFLDEIIGRLQPDYPEELKIFKRSLKQRNSQLKKLAKTFYETGVVLENDQQLSYWTKQFVAASAAIMQRRAETIDQLSNDRQSVIYQPSVQINLLSDLMSFNDLVELHTEQLKSSTKRDIAIGHSTIGAHRDDWKILSDKDVRRFGSRGEKRMAIGRLILRSHTLLEEKLGFPPLLLLDDISSELDRNNTLNILEHAISKDVQVIITTIHIDEIPDEVKKVAEVINLADLV